MILVIGGSGFVGSHVMQSALQNNLSAAYTYRSHPLPITAPAYRVDIGQGDDLEKCIRETRPTAIIYSVVTQNWLDEKLQTEISLTGVERVIAALRKQNSPARLIYVSTNSVFSGIDGPYPETCPPDPSIRQDQYRFYGIGRALGEQAALEKWANTIVARTAHVEGRTLSGELNLRMAREVEVLRSGQPLQRFCNRILSPTLVDNLAQALLEIASPDFPYRGILHLAGSQPLSNFEYSQKIATALGCDLANIQPDWFENTYQLPRAINNIALDVTFTQKLLKTRLLDVNELLKSVLEI
jgi:dTDP-4-dehydrorhamnose reductase